MVELIAQLLDAGFAYTVDGGDVYFAVEKLASYGSLSGRSLEDMRAGERVEPDARKHHPMDFALWKGSKEWQVSWPAPWGPGRPGWHIECSAMSMRYLGETFDIHGGGQDLLFPHHENECAQSSAVTGKPLARYWLHNGFVTINDEKMSKSLKNYVSVADVLADHSPPVIRTALVMPHYRSQVDLSPEVLLDARAVWERLGRFASSRATYFRDGNVPKTGDVVPQPEQAASLRAIAEGGADVYYRGELGERITRAMKVRRHREMAS